MVINSVYLCMRAEGSCCCVAYCTGIPLLLDAVLLISIQLLIMEMLEMLTEFLLKFRACVFLVELGLTPKVVSQGAPLGCVFHPLLPILWPCLVFINYVHVELAFNKSPDVVAQVQVLLLTVLHRVSLFHLV